MVLAPASTARGEAAPMLLAPPGDVDWAGRRGQACAPVAVQAGKSVAHGGLLSPHAITRNTPFCDTENIGGPPNISMAFCSFHKGGHYFMFLKFFGAAEDTPACGTKP